MLTSTCTIALTFLAGNILQRGTFPSARFLPKEGTLLAASFAPPQKLWQHRGAIAQLGIWENERVHGVFRYAAASDETVARTFESLPQVRKLVEVFDRGWTGGLLFTMGTHGPQPRLFLAGSASEAGRTRRVDNLIAKLLRTDDRPKLELARRPIADSPVSASSYSMPRFGSDTWRSWLDLTTVVKGRHASFAIGRMYSDNSEEGTKKVVDATLEAASSLVGLGRRGRGGHVLGKPIRVGEGETPLGRFVLRMRENLLSPKYGPRGGETDRIEKSGIAQWIGVQSCLSIDADGTPRTRAEIHYADDEKAPSLFECFKGNARGLGDEAAALPASALAAMRVAIDGKHTAAWIVQGLGEAMRFGEDDAESMLRWASLLAGLGWPEGTPDLAGLEDVTAALVPQAAGSLLPELVLVFRTPGEEGQGKEILAQLAKLLGRGDALEVKTLGKGEDMIPYLPLKKLLAAAGGGADLLVASLFGGGFVSAKRAGERLYVGFNPRTLRKVLRAVRKGDTLTQRTGFAARFPQGSGRALEAWFDFPAVARSLKAVDNGLPLMFVSRAAVAPAAVGPGVVIEGPKADPKPQEKKQPKPKLVMPRTSDIAAAVREEWLWSEKAAHGWTLHARGGTLLSPSAWAGVVMAGAVWDELCGLNR